MDMELTTADLKQAEAMVVAWDARDPMLIRAFEQEKDVHRIRAVMAFLGYSNYLLVPPDDLLSQVTVVCPTCSPTGLDKCNHAQRQVAKIIGHASAYMMGARKMANKVLPEADVFLPEGEVRRIQSVIISPAIKEWQMRPFSELKASPWLINGYGLRREFYGMLDNEMVREALSWKAQSTVSCITNQAMRRMHRWCIELSGKGLEYCRVVTQTHDALTISHPARHRDAIYKMLEKAFHHELVYHGRPLVIPIECGSGPNWRATH